MSPTCSRWSFEQTNRSKEGVEAPVLCLCPASLVTEWARLPKEGKDAKYWQAGLHKLWYPSIRDMGTWSKFGAHKEHGDVFLFSNLGAL